MIGEEGLVFIEGLGNRMTDAPRGVLGLQESSQRGSDVRDIGLTIEMPRANALTHEDEGDVCVVG